jgi:hypothetical protein
LGAPQLIPPHISLLYTLDRNSQAPQPDFDDERLKAIAAGCAEAIDDAHFTLGRPVVNSTGEGEHDVCSWNVIRSLILEEVGEDQLAAQCHGTSFTHTIRPWNRLWGWQRRRPDSRSHQESAFTEGYLEDQRSDPRGHCPDPW